MFVWHHHSIFFTLLVGPILVTGVAFSFFFFSTQTHWIHWRKKKRRPNYWKKKRKKELHSQPRKKKFEQPTQDKKKKKKRTVQPTQEKKKVKRWSKIVTVSPYVCLITILSLSYELWKLKTTFDCFQFS